MVSCVTGPSPVTASQQNTPVTATEPPKTAAKPLSPIISPMASPRPLLKLDTATLGEFDLPPQVPPKSPAVERKGSPAPLVLSSKASRTQLMTPATMTSAGNTPLSAVDFRRSPNTMPLSTPPTAFTNPFSSASPASSRGSPRVERKDPLAAAAASHARNQSESSIMDRGRPSRRPSKSTRHRAMSETTNLEAAAQDTWQLPQGMRVAEASRRLSDADKSLLHKQAYDQAGNFEVLNKRDVASLSRVSVHCTNYIHPH